MAAFPKGVDVALTYAKGAPRVVAQSKKNPNCWAAALECWIAEQKPKTVFTSLAAGLSQKDLAIHYKDHVHASGGLLKSGLDRIVFDLQMGFDVLLQPKIVFTGAYIHRKLAGKGYLWCAFGGNAETTTQMGHVVVIYGIDDAYTSHCAIRYMDPWHPGNIDKPIDYFQNSKSMLVAWAEREEVWFQYMKKNWKLP